MGKITRRTFVQTAAASAFLIGASRRAAASETVRHAVIGLGGQGLRHAKTFGGFDDCELVAVCDLDPERRAEARQASETVRLEEDFHRVLDDDSIDSVSIATPDHWHTPIALLALQAGKHVYVEKPCCHNVVEGFWLEKAANETGLCVQHGTQARSGAGNREAIQFLRDGGIGTVRMAKAINHQLRGSIGRAPQSEPPAGVDYDRWLGPAPKVPFTRNRWHYNWHWFWDYGCGDIGNDGIHQIDVARWGLGQHLPRTIVASGGQLYYNDDHETPDTQTVVYEYDSCQLIYEMRLWTNYKMEGHDNGVIFYGDNGTLELGRHGVHVTLIGEERKPFAPAQDFASHPRNFLDALKANDPTMLHAPAREAAASSILCHLGNIGTRVGARLRWDDAKHQTDVPEANALLGRTYRAGYELADVS